MKKRRNIYQILALVLLVLLSLTYIMPFYWLIRSSVMNSTDVFTMPPILWPDKLHLENYQEVWANGNFAGYAANSIQLTILNIGGVLLSASLAAYGFSRFSWKYRDKIFGVLLISMMLTSAATLIPQYLLWFKVGFIGTKLPLIIPAFFAPVYYTFMMRQFMLSIPKDFDDAAYLDGASSLQIYWHIILPYSKPVLITVALFVFLSTWNDFLAPLVYLQKARQYTLAIGLNYFKGTYTTSYNLLMAASAIITLPVIIFYFLGQKFFVQGANIGGIKG